ncbi:MAG: ammonia channel protein, partial [Telmatospirillum sp.]|nr:ammonia channel protein [Telmatospirillum sp.]
MKSVIKRSFALGGLALGLSLLATAGLAQEAAPAAAAAAAAAAPAALDKADTAGMLTSTALVLLMTIPGLALFYA